MSALYVRDLNGNFVPILTIKGDQGISLQFNWRETELGIKRDVDPTYEYVDLKGAPGINSDMYKAVYDPNNLQLDAVGYDNTISEIEATTVKTAIDALSVYKAYHVNIINPALLLNGAINPSTGNFSAAGGYKATDFLPVTVGDVYSCNTVSATKPCFYDTNKVKLSFAANAVNFTIPADCVYMRMTFLTSSTPDPMCNRGATLLTYVPYVEPEMQLKTGYIRTGIIKDLMTDATVRTYINQMILEQGASSGLFGLKWAVLGDSQTQGTPRYHTYIAQRTGCTILNYGIGGTSIEVRAGRTDSMLERFPAMDDTADIVTVCGGPNGSNGPLGVMSDRVNNTFYGALHLLYSGLIEKYPTKRVGVISFLRFFGQDLSARLAAEIEVARYYNLPFLDLYNEGGLYLDSATVRTLLIPDGVHANDAGHLKISRRIQAFIEQI